MENEHLSRVVVPRFQEFVSKDLEEEAYNEKDIAIYLPERKIKRPLPREYLYNIINTVKPSFFPKSIMDAMKARKEKLAAKRNDIISIRSDFMQFLNQGAFFSTSKRGRAVQRLKPEKEYSAAEEKLREIQKQERAKRTQEFKESLTL